jgi:hypothetical protein
MKKFIIGLGLFLFPVIAFAQQNAIGDLLETIGGLVETATPIVVGIALLAFFWGLAKYIFAGAEDDKVAGKKIMIWGIIALFVMISVWGIIEFIGTSLGISENATINVPEVPQN